ncbi:hypothetical protein SIN8267_02074 [Sinobacterium norvegicum]|uniref:Lipoprotein n=1 Tax=Sinobacterium norvegicum TaxID=1641715 RepID=A0ABM9AFJ2_9GAMM|nr:hypothetical protein [Sinobacterium norvegicum]CAH0991959.1 hypothetical protein SIN8267_02074 [Sinobacterium norvegicum]
MRSIFVLAVLLSGCTTNTELAAIEAKKQEIGQMSNAALCVSYNASVVSDDKQWLDFYEVAMTERFRGEREAKAYCLANAETNYAREQRDDRVRWSTEGEEVIRNQNSGYVEPGKY